MSDHRGTENSEIAQRTPAGSIQLFGIFQEFEDPARELKI